MVSGLPHRPCPAEA